MNDLLLEKAAYTTADLTAGAGKMTRAQADRFIDMTVNNSVMFRDGLARTLRVDHRSGRINRIKFAEPVTYGAEEGVLVTRTVKPTNSWIDYTTRKLTSARDTTTETYEENIEGDSHEETVVNAFAAQMGNDFEHVGILGDTVAYAADGSATGLLLRTMDGWYKQSSGGHMVDAGGATISKIIFSKMIRALPNYYKQRRGALCFMMSPGLVQDWRDQLASRNTDVGDQNLVGSGTLAAYGVPIREVPLIPENLDSYDGSTSYGDATFIWLTFPGNFTRVISRDIETYSEFKPREDLTQWTMYTYQGLFLQEADALVTCHSCRISGPA